MADQPPLIDCSNLGGPQDEPEMAVDREGQVGLGQAEPRPPVGAGG
jgi:hypothetical protein